MTDFWEGKRVLVTGGSGFIGSHLVEELVKRGADVTVTTFHKRNDLPNLSRVIDKVKVFKGDLRDNEFALEATKDKDIVMNLAARVAGVDFNSKHSSVMFRDNISLFIPIIEAARINKVKRFLTVSSACVYPRYCKMPINEEDGFKESPDPANEGYGWAKRMEEYLSRKYYEEYGMEIAIVRPFNTYGPRDNFNLETAHVISSLIVKIFRGDNPLVVWGNGEQSRSFIYWKDFVEGLILATEKYPKADPVNIGSDEEVSIGDLARMIVELSGREVNIKFDETKPTGQPRRVCDTKKAREILGFEAKVPLIEGLKETIKWYKEKMNIR